MYNGITIYTLTYNEEVMLPFFIRHYRKLFPNCKIVIYDNESTDSTVEIAKNNGCEVITYRTNGQLSDSTYLAIKNNCWKKSETHWNIICDCDELCEIHEMDLIYEDHNEVSLIRLKGYDMVNVSEDYDNFNVENLKFGYENQLYDKTLILNKSKIEEINFRAGCHIANPIGDIKYSNNEYRLLHYKYIGVNYMIKRYELFKERLSNENKERNWGIQYLQTEEHIKNYFRDIKKKVIKLI